VRKLFLIGGAAALIALPAAALADSSEQAPETDPTAEVGTGTTTDKALHADGRGVFRYEGSGGVTLEGHGVVRVRDLSSGKDLAAAPSGFGVTTTSKDGLVTSYKGDGTLTLDGSSFRVVVLGKFVSDVDPTATHPATGQARVAGRGTATLKGGVPVPFWAAQRILLTRGPMSVDLRGTGGREWRVVKRVVKIHKVKGPKGVRIHRVTSVSKRWHWHRGGPGATWRLNGPASGAVELTTITGRVRVWDRSDGKDLAVSVPAGTTTTALKDGSVVYSGLKGARVGLTGTAFRMKVRAWDVEGTFTPTPGTIARSFVRGKGTFETADVQDARAGRHGGVRVLLQAVPAPAK
jgi:hypothetical protein